MKKFNIIFLFALALALSSCEKGEVVTGSPIDTGLPVENIVGTISTDETEVVSTQDFFIDVTLPQKFDVDVTVQAEVLVPELNTRIRRSLVIKTGQTTDSLKVTAPSIGISQFIIPYKKYSVKIFLIAFNTASNVVPSGFVGKRYSISSNVLTLNYGDTVILDANPNKLGINFDFEGPYINLATYYNNLDLVFLKNNVNVLTAFGGQSQTNSPYYGTRTGTGRRDQININNSALPDTYTIAIYAKNISVPPTVLPNPPATTNINYRFVVRFPDETVKSFAGTLNNIAVGTIATAIPVLQIIKSSTIVGGVSVASYKISQLP